MRTKSSFFAELKQHHVVRATLIYAAAVGQTLKLAAGTKGSNRRFNQQESAGQLYAQAGRADLAVPLLAKVLAAPNSGDILAPVLLRLNPQFDPIRHAPRFQALLKKYPVPTPFTAPVAAARG